MSSAVSNRERPGRAAAARLMVAPRAVAEAFTSQYAVPASFVV